MGLQKPGLVTDILKWWVEEVCGFIFQSWGTCIFSCRGEEEKTSAGSGELLQNSSCFLFIFLCWMKEKKSYCELNKRQLVLQYKHWETFKMQLTLPAVVNTHGDHWGCSVTLPFSHESLKSTVCGGNNGKHWERAKRQQEMAPWSWGIIRNIKSPRNNMYIMKSLEN